MQLCGDLSRLFCGSVWASGIESGLRMTPITADQGRLLTRTLRAQPPREQLFIFGEWVLVLGLAATLAGTTLCLGGY